MADIYQNPFGQLASAGLYQQQAAMQNQTIWDGSSYGITTSGTSNIYYNPLVIEQEQPKKQKRFIAELREELRKWHGDLYSVLN